MSFLGIHLTLMIGPTVAVPATPDLTEALESVTVTHNDDQRSGFQIVFRAGRGSPLGAADYPLLLNPLLRPFNRVILVVIFDVMPRVLIDGIVTHQQLAPGTGPGAGKLTVTGEDISLKMDLQEKTQEHPMQDEMLIAMKLIGSYGLIPMVIPPPVIDPPIAIDRTPVQQATDLRFLLQMAERYGYVFYVQPGPAPYMNFGYWGPPKRMDLPQKAISVNMGPESNCENIRFSHNALSPQMVEGRIQDRLTNSEIPVQTFASTRVPLSTQPSWAVNFADNRRTFYRESGVSTIQAFARAQGITDASADSISAEGEIDALTYGEILQPRGLVGLRGAGYSYDGLYYVKSVTHSIGRGQYKQQFLLKRDGVGSTTPVVMP